MLQPNRHRELEDCLITQDLIDSLKDCFPMPNFSDRRYYETNPLTAIAYWGGTRAVINLLQETLNRISAGDSSAQNIIMED